MARRKRSNSNYTRRGTDTRSKRKVLIYCEGSETEPNYFNSFPLKPEEIEIDCLGQGENTESLVREAIRRRDEAQKKRKPYNEVWCVFDEDNFPPPQFNSAIQLAKKNSMKVAWSNKCFELWILLHFQYHQAAWTEKQYETKLKDCFGSYNKSDPEIYERLKDNQVDAIHYAKKLYNERPNLGSPQCCNPCTTVFKLVERLNEFLDDNE